MPTVYQIAPGIKVRKDHRDKWTVFIEKNGRRTNRTIGEGRDGLTQAIKAAEAVAAHRTTGLGRKKPAQAEKNAAPTFFGYAKRWYREGWKKWKDETQVRYEEVLRLYINPHPCFKKPLDQLTRGEIKEHLRGVYQKRSPATVEIVHSVISGVFNEAIDDELVAGNPAVRLLHRILPAKNRRNMKPQPADPLSADECTRFFAAALRVCSSPEQMVLKVMAFAG